MKKLRHCHPMYRPIITMIIQKNVGRVTAFLARFVCKFKADKSAEVFGMSNANA